MHHGNPLRPAPSGEREELTGRIGPAEAVNGKMGNRIAELGDSIDPRSVAMEADGIHAETAAIDSFQQLDHLALRATGDVPIDEDGNGNLCRHGVEDHEAADTWAAGAASLDRGSESRYCRCHSSKTTRPHNRRVWSRRAVTCSRTSRSTNRGSK
jgi:hypothetical protein